MSWELVTAGLDPIAVAGLLAASLVASFITVALGIGGGGLLLAVMASLMPPAALLPVHGVVQLGSNAGRALLLIREVYWPPFAAFAVGTLAGVFAGGLIVVDLPPAAIQIGIGAFILWSVLATPPAWLSAYPWLTGAVSSFLTMFFGATGLFVANFTKSLSLPRQRHVATHAMFMTLQHLAKILAFGFLGFAFAPWAGFIVAMILAGFVGTLAGRMLLERMSDRGFKRALDAVLVLLSLQLVWSGIAGLI